MLPAALILLAASLSGCVWYGGDGYHHHYDGGGNGYGHPGPGYYHQGY